MISPLPVLMSVTKKKFSFTNEATEPTKAETQPAAVLKKDPIQIVMSTQETKDKEAKLKKEEEEQKKQDELKKKQQEKKNQQSNDPKSKDKTAEASKQKNKKLKPVETKEQRTARILRYQAEEEEERKKEKNTADTSQQALSVIFSGHVDHGKSSMSGHIMVNLGQVDDRQIQKFKQEAAKTVGESWAYAFALDACQEEREKGKTVESARATFKTESGRRIVLLDSPGHKGFIKSMIESAAQADVAVLVTSARKGEFEAGLDRSGQTAEHALILHISGVQNLIVAINKMDDPTCAYDQGRYEFIKNKLEQYLVKNVGFKKENIQFVPVSALEGENLTTKLPEGHKMGWYQGPSLIDLIDQIQIPKRDLNGFLRACVSGKYQDQGYFAVVKVEKGTISKGTQYKLMPSYEDVTVQKIEDEAGNDIQKAQAGENCRVQINEAMYQNITDGMVFCDKGHPCESAKQFIAKFTCVSHPSVLTAGFQAILHLNTLTTQCSVIDVIGLDPETGKINKQLPKMLKPGQTGLVEFQVNDDICINKFNAEPFLGMILVRCEQDTIGMGEVVKLCYE